MRNVATMRATIDIALPCLDEAPASPWEMTRIPDGTREIVVDNGSTGGSPEIAATRGAQVVKCSQRGYSAPCHTALLAAKADIVAFCDCDSSLDPGEGIQLARKLLAGADLVISRRRPTTYSAWPLPARMAYLPSFAAAVTHASRAALLPAAS